MKLSLGRFKDKFTAERFSVGLDIGTSTFKFVKLKFLKDIIEIYDFNLEPIPADLVSALKSIAQFQEAKSVNLGVCGPGIVIRCVEFPRMNTNELKGALNFEAQKHIPFPVAEVNLDAHILKPDLPENKMLVLLAAAKKEFINQRLKIIEEAGLKANLLDLDALTLVNAFNFNYSLEDNLKNKAIALLNIGASFSNLNILENDLCLLTRDIHIAGNNFTQKIADTLSLDFKAAEDLKLNPDKEKLEKVVVAVESVLSDLANELRTSFDYYESQSTLSVAKIFLSGGGSKFLGLKDILTNLLGIEVDYWDPLRKIILADSLDTQKLKAQSSQLAVAVGLALRG
jgi:type IV pilus assembly protein PilM